MVELLLCCAPRLLSSFRAGDYLPFMERMAERHSREIRRDMAMISRKEEEENVKRDKRHNQQRRT